MNEPGRPDLPILGDPEVRAVPVTAMISTIRDAIVAHDRGELEAPARARVDLPLLGDARLLFTVGGTRSAVGYRVYANGRDLAIQQVTIVHDRQSGELLGLIQGYEFGARRTAAIGAVAVDALARADAASVGLVGTGMQAMAQLWAISAVRKLDEIRVYSRDQARREAFAARGRNELGLDCRGAADARTAVEGADIVILSTTSATPVIETEWIQAGAHVTTMGPKTVDEHEAPASLAERASVIVTDSYAQLTGYGRPSWLTLAAGQLERVQTLGALITGRAAGRQAASDITLFCSVGLAGSEVVLGERLLREWNRS